MGKAKGGRRSQATQKESGGDVANDVAGPKKVDFKHEAKPANGNGTK